MNRLRGYLPIVVLVACLAAIVPMQHWLDAHREGLEAPEEILYFAGSDDLRRYSLGYDALLADIYWMRAIQFYGRKVIENPRVISERSNELALLYSMIDVATTLDPHYIEPYRFGGYFVHDYVDPKRGVELLEKGVRNNPDAFHLHLDLAYLYWSDGNCTRASELYRRASEMPGAPTWTRELSATILADCGAVKVTIKMLEQLHDSTDDPRLRKEILEKLAAYVALDEVTFLGRAAASHRELTGAWPASLPAVVRAAERLSDPDPPRLRLAPNGVPLDPSGRPYLYDPATGALQTDPMGTRIPEATMRGIR
jgi:hypothetical protein